jgi:hypothetical protein
MTHSHYAKKVQITGIYCLEYIYPVGLCGLYKVNDGIARVVIGGQISCNGSCQIIPSLTGSAAPQAWCNIQIACL